VPEMVPAFSRRPERPTKVRWRGSTRIRLSVKPADKLVAYGVERTCVRWWETTVMILRRHIGNIANDLRNCPKMPDHGNLVM